MHLNSAGLCSSCSLPFWEKEKANNLKNEIKEVEELDNWQAPMPFLHGFFSAGRSKKSQQNKAKQNNKTKNQTPPETGGFQKSNPLGGFMWH